MAEFKESQDSVHTMLCRIEKHLEKLPTPGQNDEDLEEDQVVGSIEQFTSPPPGLS